MEEERLRLFRRDAPASELARVKLETIDRFLRPESTKEAALLVIDMQRGFLDAGAALEVPDGRTKCLPKVVELVGRARSVGVPVVFTAYAHRRGGQKLSSFPFSPEVFEHQPGTPEGPFHPSGCCLEGDPSSRIVDELKPDEGELVIEKDGYDAFYETELDTELRSRGIRCLYVCGVLTDICVDSTLRSAFQREYRVTAISDAVGTMWPSIQEACLDIWKRKFARLRTTSEVLSEMATLDRN